MLALARKIVADEEDAGSVESVFAQARQVAAEAAAPDKTSASPAVELASCLIDAFAIHLVLPLQSSLAVEGELTEDGLRRLRRRPHDPSGPTLGTDTSFARRASRDRSPQQKTRSDGIRFVSETPAARTEFHQRVHSGSRLRSLGPLSVPTPSSAGSPPAASQ